MPITGVNLDTVQETVFPTGTPVPPQLQVTELPEVGNVGVVPGGVPYWQNAVPKVLGHAVALFA